jgi:hypothetical protein
VEVLSGDAPLPGAQIIVYEREPADRAVSPARWDIQAGGESGADGRWEAPLPPGSYDVVARLESLAPVSPCRWRRSPSPLRTSQPGSETAWMSLTRRSSSPPAASRESFGSHWISGKVIRKDGSPVLGARVGAWRP